MAVTKTITITEEENEICKKYFSNGKDNFSKFVGSCIRKFDENCLDIETLKEKSKELGNVLIKAKSDKEALDKLLEEQIKIKEKEEKEKFTIKSEKERKWLIDSEIFFTKRRDELDMRIRGYSINFEKDTILTEKEFKKMVEIAKEKE